MQTLHGNTFVTLPPTGPDVSAWQPYVDFAKVREVGGHSFAYIKATEGEGYLSPTFAAHWKAANDVGDLLVGAYHFARWLGDPVRQAEFFARSVGELREGHLPPVLDLEWISKVKTPPPSVLVPWALKFLEACERLFNRWPMLYTGPSFWRYNLLPLGSAALDLTSWPIWLASYTGTAKPLALKGATKWAAPLDNPLVSQTGDNLWTIWQHTGKGRCPGVTDGQGNLVNCDLNVFAGTLGELRRWAMVTEAFAA